MVFFEVFVLFSIRVILASYNELGSISSSSDSVFFFFFHRVGAEALIWEVVWYNCISRWPMWMECSEQREEW